MVLGLENYIFLKKKQLAKILKNCFNNKIYIIIKNRIKEYFKNCKLWLYFYYNCYIIFIILMMIYELLSYSKKFSKIIKQH